MNVGQEKVALSTGGSLLLQLLLPGLPPQALQKPVLLPPGLMVRALLRQHKRPAREALTSSRAINTKCFLVDFISSPPRRREWIELLLGDFEVDVRIDYLRYTSFSIFSVCVDCLQYL